MKKYIKKPVEVEAIQYNKNKIGESLDFCDKMQYNSNDNEYYIKTLEGKMKVSERDYIIKGIKGEFYPCKPDIFEATYQSVDNFIDLNKLKNYKCLAYPNATAQLMKVLEEVEEVKQAITLENGHMWLKEENRDNVISEVFDVIQASINLLYVIGINEEDFEKHIEKLNVYKETKYKK